MNPPKHCKSTVIEHEVRYSTVGGDKENKDKNKSNFSKVAILLVVFAFIVFIIASQNKKNKGAYADSSRVTTVNNNVAAESKKNNFSLYTEKSKLTDSEDVYVSIKSNDTILGAFGTKVRPVLWFRCMDNKTDVYVDFEIYLGINNINVTYRVDDEKAKTMSCTVSTNNKAIFIRSPMQFIKSLYDKDNIFMRLFPYGENARDVEFNVSGLKEAIVPLQKSCNWK